MIRINLLSSKVRAQINPQLTAVAVSPDLILTKKEIYKQASIRILVMLVFPMLFYMYDNYYFQLDMSSQIPPLKKRIEELIAFNKAKEKFVKDIKQFEEEGKIIQGKIDKIKFLNKQRAHEIEIHKFFQNSMPEKLWLEEFEYYFDPSKDDSQFNQIKIKGLAVNPTDVQNLRNDIKKHILFNSCEIVNQKTKDYKGQRLESFEMVIQLGKTI